MGGRFNSRTPDRNSDTRIEMNSSPRGHMGAKPGVWNTLRRHKVYVAVGLLTIALFTCLAVTLPMSNSTSSHRRLPNEGATVVKSKYGVLVQLYKPEHSNNSLIVDGKKLDSGTCDTVPVEDKPFAPVLKAVQEIATPPLSPTEPQSGSYKSSLKVPGHLLDYRLCKNSQEIGEMMGSEDALRDLRKPDATTLQSGPARIQVEGASLKEANGYYKKMPAKKGPPTKFYETGYKTSRERYWTNWTNGRVWYEQEGGAHWIRFNDDNTTITWKLETAAAFPSLYESVVTGDSHNPTLKAKWELTDFGKKQLDPNADNSSNQMNVTPVRD